MTMHIIVAELVCHLCFPSPSHLCFPSPSCRTPEFDMSELESLFSTADTNSQRGSGDRTSGRTSLGQKSVRVQLVLIPLLQLLQPILDILFLCLSTFMTFFILYPKF